MSYENLSPEGKAVAETIELHYWAKWQENHAGGVIPDGLIEEIERRKQELPEGAREAVISFLKPPISHSTGHPIFSRRIWLEWLAQYVGKNPYDYGIFNTLQKAFDNQELNNDTEWQMPEHKPKCTA